jgi:hypothetical protein
LAVCIEWIPLVLPVDVPGTPNLTWTVTKPVAAGAQIDGFCRRHEGERSAGAICAPKLQAFYTFKGHPAEYSIYKTSPGKTFGRFTFIDGVQTDFAEGGKTPLGQILDGR